MVPIAIKLCKKPPNKQSPSTTFLYFIVTKPSLFYSTARNMLKKESRFSVSSIFSTVSAPFLYPIKVYSDSNKHEYVLTVVLRSEILKDFGFV